MENSLARGTIEALIAEDVLADALPHRFTHPILRDAVFDDAPHATRAREHADAARMLLGEGAESLAAHHLRLGEPQGDPAVDRARRRGNAMLFARASALRGWVSLRYGRPADAEADARGALELDEAARFNAVLLPVAVGVLIGAVLECRGPVSRRHSLVRGCGYGSAE